MADGPAQIGIPVNLRTSGGVEITTLSATITEALPAGTNNIGDVDVLTLPAGTVAGAASLPAGTNNIGDVDLLSGPTGASALQFQGSAAHGASDAGGPVKTGSVAVAHGANPTAVTAGQRTDNYANRAGIPFHIGGHPNIQTLRANYTSAQTDTAIVTVGAGAKIVVTAIMVTADAANSVDVAVIIGFGTANTPTTTGVVASHPGIPAASGGGFARGDGSGILGIGADNEDLRITSEVPTGGSISVIVTYFTIES